MARTSKRDKLTRYRGRVERALRWRKQQDYDGLWERMVELYRGKHYIDVETAEDRVAVNVAFSTINVIYPSVSVNFPKITVSATKPEDEDKAVITEAVLNYQWRHHDIHEPVRRAVKDYLIIGHGWLKVGYRFKEQEQQLNEDERADAFEAAVMQANDFAAANPDLAEGLPTDEDIAANLPETQLVVVEDRPFVERVSPFDIVVDSEATCMDDLKWIAQRIVKPLEEVKKDERYRHSARNRLKADASVHVDDSDERWRHGKERDDIDRVTLWEFYDLESGTVCVFADGGDEYLIEPTKMPYAYGQPFVMLRNYDVPDSFYPMGDLEAIECLQGELNKTRSQMMNARKKNVRKYLYHERALDATGVQALQSDEDNTLVPVADETRPLNEVVVPLMQEPFSPEAYSYSDIIKGDIDTVSGVSEYSRGAVPEIRRTATEASIIQDAINARSADKLAQIERGISLVARRVVAVCQQFMTGEQVARVVGFEGQVLWVPYSREDIMGEYDFSVEAGSTQPMNETFRRQQAIALMQVVGPMVGTVIDPVALARHVLQFGFGIKTPEKFLIQQPPGMAPPMQGGVQPGGVPGMQPAPPNGDPSQQPEQGQPAPAGQGNIDPAILAQLAAQVGLNPTHLAA